MFRLYDTWGKALQYIVHALTACSIQIEMLTCFNSLYEYQSSVRSPKGIAWTVAMTVRSLEYRRCGANGSPILNGTAVGVVVVDGRSASWRGASHQIGWIGRLLGAQTVHGRFNVVKNRGMSSTWVKLRVQQRRWHNRWIKITATCVSVVSMGRQEGRIAGMTDGESSRIRINRASVWH